MDDELINGRFWSFEKAKAYINSLKFDSISDFRRWWYYGGTATEDTPLFVNRKGLECPHRPSFLPYCPEAVYGRTFTTIHDYVLGRRAKRKSEHNLEKYPIWSYAKSSSFVKAYAFTNQDDYLMYCLHSSKQKPGDPNYVNLNNISCPKRPQGLPTTPKQTLFRKWTTWKEYLHGKKYTETYITHHNRLYYQYEVSKDYLKKLKFTNINDYYDWIEYSHYQKAGDPWFVTSTGKPIRRKPTFIPSKPKLIYKDKWISLHSYLSMHNAEDTNSKPRVKRVQSVHIKFDPSQAFTYEEACEYIQLYKFTNQAEFERYITHCTPEPFITRSGFSLPILPCNFPKTPECFYRFRGTWVSWRDFLGLTEVDDNHEQFAELFEKAKYTHYRYISDWYREANKIGPGLVGYVNRAARLNQWEGLHSALSRTNIAKCSYDDAKILLSFRDLKNQSQYIKWYKKHKFPFFMPSLESHQTLQRAYNDDTVTIDDYLTTDIVEKLNTQKRASPVFVITLTHDNDFRLDIIKAGKFDAYLKFANNTNSYVFDLNDKLLLDNILSEHCTQFNDNEYTANHLGMLYSSIRNNFKQINFAAIYD